MMAKIKEARKQIEEALKKATFQMAGFGFDKDLDKKIKEKTHLYRVTWIIPPLMEALKGLDPCKECRGTGIALSNGYIVKDCESCKGTGIAGGLHFDPYKMAEEARGKVFED